MPMNVGGYIKSLPPTPTLTPLEQCKAEVKTLRDTDVSILEKNQKYLSSYIKILKDEKETMKSENDALRKEIAILKK